MNDLPRQKLCEIIATYGRSICDDPRRCEGLLRDFCGEYKREVSVLVQALKERVAIDLLTSSDGVPREVLLARLMKRLLDNLALAEDAARWAVESWAVALGVISNAECETFGLKETELPEEIVAVKKILRHSAVREDVVQELLRRHAAAKQKKKGTTPTAKKQGSATEKTAKKSTKSAQVHPLDQTTPPLPFPPQETPPSQTIIVSQQGQGQYRTISQAIANAQPGTRILIHPGRYYEGLIINKPLELTNSGRRGEAEIESMDSACLLMQTDRAVVRGLTLRGRAGLKRQAFCAVDIPQGQLLIEDCDITSDSLACVAIHGPTSDPIIRKCRIHGVLEKRPAGILASENSRGTIEDCEIFGHAEVGVMISKSGSLTIRRCEIRDGEKAGIFITNSSVGTVEGCTISNNVTGIMVTERGSGRIENCNIFSNTVGVIINKDGNPTIRRSKVHNEKQGGIFIYENGKGRVEDCDIFGNGWPGVMISQGGNPIIQRCQIHDGKQGGLLVYKNGKGTIEDCAIFANTLSGVEIKENGNPIIRRCQINRNGGVAIEVSSNGGENIKNCDLTDNVQGARNIKRWWKRLLSRWNGNKE
jgi:parallel beta-helix repeat protein